MPEGDTVFRAAKVLRAALEGSVLTGCDVRVPKFATVDLSGETVHSVESRGKHILMRVGDATIHSHLKMEGVWQVYRDGERWRRPAHEARIVLRTADVQAVGFALGVLEIVPTAEEDDVVGYLGPDILGPDWDAGVALANMREQGDRSIGLTLLDQRVMAGLGNVFRSEICFLKGTLPTRPTDGVGPLEGWIDISRRVLVANRDRPERVFTGDTRKGRQKYVYGRAGKPCYRCGTKILDGRLGDPVASGEANQDRIYYYCPRCQS
ncbi:MAG: DNA-formamidopyrimidine glycosylase family protein [Naasia sp.]